MQICEFRVQGSAAEPYIVTFRKDGTNLSAYCTCPAGGNGQYCKHRFRILDGDPTGIVSANAADVALVASWLPGTDVEQALQKVRELELETARLTRELTSAKKTLARALLS